MKTKVTTSSRTRSRPSRPPQREVDAVLDQLDDAAAGSERPARAGASLATRSIAARACRASAVEHARAKLARTRRAPARRRRSAARNAGGYSMPPFIGPITTGAPSPYSKDGSRGDTGIGWCTTSMPCSRTSSCDAALRELGRHARQEAGREVGDLVGQVLADPPHRQMKARVLDVDDAILSGEQCSSSSRVRACVTSHTGTPRPRNTRK